MSFEVIATEPFERKLKKLAKKYKTIRNDLSLLINSLSKHPIQGTPLGKDCYKIRFAIASKGKGKSGSARLISYVRIVNQTVYLLDIYDKSDQSTITDKELKLLLEILLKK